MGLHLCALNVLMGLNDTWCREGGFPDYYVHVIKSNLFLVTFRKLLRLNLSHTTL